MDTGSYAAVLNRNNGATTLLRSAVTGTINNEVDNPDKLRFFESTLVTGGITGKAVYRKAVYWNGDYLSQWRLYGYNDTTLFNTHVAFPTWTSANGQDDLTWNDAYGPNQVTDSTGTFFYYNVQRSDHNNELGEYVTHVYVYPLSGSMYSVGAYTYNYPTTANG